MANRIMLNETSYHGAGAIQEIATEALGRGFSKALICSDPDLIKFGVTAKVTEVLDKAGLAYDIYSNIKANPTIENVQLGVEAFKKALNEPYTPGTPFTDAQIYSNMGMALSSLRRYSEALHALKKAQSLGLNNPSIEKELLWLRNNVGLF